MALCSTHTQIPRHPYRGRRCCTEWGNRFRPASSLLHLLAASWPEPEPEPTHRDEAETRSGLRSAEGREQESESLLPHMGKMFLFCSNQVELAVLKYFVGTNKLLVQSLVYTYQKVVK